MKYALKGEREREKGNKYVQKSWFDEKLLSSIAINERKTQRVKSVKGFCEPMLFCDSIKIKTRIEEWKRGRERDKQKENSAK